MQNHPSSSAHKGKRLFNVILGLMAIAIPSLIYAQVDVAANKPTTASSIEKAGFESAKAVDGNATTRWSSAWNVDPQWIRIDLGAAYPVNRVKLTWENSNAKNYQLQLSNDGTTFIAMTNGTKTNMPAGARVDDCTALSGTGRYLRVYGTARNPNPADGKYYGYSLFSCEVYTTTSANQPPVANAGPDQRVENGAIVTLNGQASSDPDNGPQPLTYTWTRIQGTATLNNPTSATPSFTATYDILWVNPKFELKVSDGEKMSVDTVEISMYGADNVFPSRVEAEEYLTAGDATPGNTGSGYRQGDVDIQPCSDIGGGYNTGWTQAGEWLEYAFNFARTGNYRLTFRVASQAAGTKSMDVQITDATGVHQIPVTFDYADGWQSWHNVAVDVYGISAYRGLTMRITMNSPNINVNYIAITDLANIVTNGDFSEGAAHWNKYYNAPASGDLGIEKISINPAARLTIANAGNEIWHVQLYQVVNLAAGKRYTFDFDIRSESANKQFVMFCEKNGGDYATYMTRQETITNGVNSWQHYQVSWDQAETVSAKIGWKLGTFNANNVWVDNALLRSNEAAKFSLTTLSTPTAGGTITLSPTGGSYDPGTVVTITAMPANGYSFTNWSGARTDNLNPATITMDGNKSVTANFTGSNAVPIRTHFKAIVLHYDPILSARWGGNPLSYGYPNYYDPWRNNADSMVTLFCKTLRDASAGQVDWEVAYNFDLNEFPPSKNSVQFTADNFPELYHADQSQVTDYSALLNDSRFGIREKIEAGLADAVFILAFPNAGMAEWLRAQYIVNCSKDFIVFGFNYQRGVDCMLEDAAHMTEGIMGIVCRGWPRLHEVATWSSGNISAAADRSKTNRYLNDWQRFILSDAMDLQQYCPEHFSAEGFANAGISHFPPNANYGYGWGSLDLTDWVPGGWVPIDGEWSAYNNSTYFVAAGNGVKTIKGSPDAQCSMSDFVLDGKIRIVNQSSSSHAGVLFRFSKFGAGPNNGQG
jgi:hypothetical protein